ncbi:MAG: hypothetical protein IJ752_01055 [Alphaproteobacteria bacterium]|nr:hypothetical protein [Alphaproteobacteria bacterium]
MKMIVEDQTFEVVLEQNETAASFLKMLPLTVEMADLNANEKYRYLDKALPSAPEYVGQIASGDVMLFGNDCLVIFYKSFQTSYPYTKIGRIAGLPDLKSLSEPNTVRVVFSGGE